MPIIDIFSKRQKRMRDEVPDMLEYDDFPMPLRRKIVQIFKKAIAENASIYFDPEYQLDVIGFYEYINDSLCHEYGIETLNDREVCSYRAEVFHFLLNAENVEQVIDTIELCCKTIDFVYRYIHDEYQDRVFESFGIEDRSGVAPDEALSELNDRLKEHGVGYQYANGKIIRVDSTVMHEEMTKPTLQLLHNDKFKGAEEEYLTAHVHYRHGRNRECLLYCCNAFESTMKTICKEKSWQFDETKDTANKLIQICIDRKLIPSFLEEMLKKGVSKIRNELAAHGQGQNSRTVDDEITRYCLNLTGANIIFLVEKSGIK